MLSATLFKRPNGASEEITITEIDAVTASFFKSNNVSVSLEDTGTDFVVWADAGLKLDDGTPDEITVTASGRDCWETMAELRDLVRQALDEKHD
tara:strand:+ start:47 stop:328 length:282 start_codon:yes stop_codon:yes gene_type:complete